MVDIKEFITESSIVGEGQTATQINLRHPGKFVTLVCPAAYSSVTFDVTNTYSYWTIAWLNWPPGNLGPGSRISHADAEAAMQRTLPKSSSENVTMKPGDAPLELRLKEGALMSSLFPGWQVWQDSDIDISIVKVVDVSGKDVTPTPEPRVNTVWTDLAAWVDEYKWYLIAAVVLVIMALLGYAYVRYLDVGRVGT